jgi:hypothetical protein
MSLIIRQKRGALELSINAIVVLILAITMLGLGLGFMRNMFGQTSSQFDEIAGDMKNQIIEEIKSSGERLILNKYDITMKKSETIEVYYGIRNVNGATKTAKITVRCSTGMASGDGTKIVPKSFSEWDVPGSDISVLKMSIKSESTVAPDTYPCNMDVEIDGEDLKKDFFVTIK